VSGDFREKEGKSPMTSRTGALKAVSVATLAGAAVFLCCHLVLSSAMWGQNRAEPKSAEAIPRESYKTWSLFLVCNPEWLLPASNERLKNLYDQFQAFGTAIGPDHLAVWFWKGKPNPSSPRLAADLDVDRSTRFCRAYNLPPSHSPYVLVTSVYPDPDNPQVPPNLLIEFGGRNPELISKNLAELSDQLVLKGLKTKTPDSKEYWATWFEAARASLKDVSDRVTVTINTSFLKVEVSGNKHQE
jgi:hypothetical protein